MFDVSYDLLWIDMIITCAETLLKILIDCRSVVVDLLRDRLRVALHRRFRGVPRRGQNPRLRRRLFPCSRIPLVSMECPRQMRSHLLSRARSIQGGIGQGKMEFSLVVL